MRQVGHHAIVVGASISGLLAARVLTDFYETVTLIECDILPEIGQSRKGVPQGRHSHGLHSRGREIMETLFPGLTADMLAQGGIRGDVSTDFGWYMNGDFLKGMDSGLDGLLVSRPRLEGGIRAHLLRLPNVHLIENCSVKAFATNADATRITGLHLNHRTGGDELLNADLVVDASGRGSRTLAWLAELGYTKPKEERVEIDLTYMTCQFRPVPGKLERKMGMAIEGELPKGRNGVLLVQEGDRWIVTLGGYNGESAPLDVPSFVEYASTLASPSIYNAIKDAEPIGEPIAFHIPASIRQRYERVPRFPDGLLVVGDAICSFNPVYAQGMTVAANEAMALRDVLAKGGNNLSKRFFKQASIVIDGPWQVAVGGDMRFPFVEGKRSPMVRFINWYLRKLHSAAHNDAEISVSFLRVVNMIDHPSSLMHPRTLMRVIRGNMARRQPVAAPVSASAEA